MFLSYTLWTVFAFIHCQEISRHFLDLHNFWIIEFLKIYRKRIKPLFIYNIDLLSNTFKIFYFLLNKQLFQSCIVFIDQFLILNKIEGFLEIFDFSDVNLFSLKCFQVVTKSLFFNQSRNYHIIQRTWVIRLLFVLNSIERFVLSFKLL